MTSPQPHTPLPALERAIKSERAILAVAIALISLLAWVYLLGGAGTGMTAASMSTWQISAIRRNCLWSRRVDARLRNHDDGHVVCHDDRHDAAECGADDDDLRPRLCPGSATRARSQDLQFPIASFAAGYLLCWLAFSVLATALQFFLEHAGLVDGMWMWSLSRALTGGLLVLAGLYQFSSLKRACLNHCRSPAAFLSQNWRPGPSGAFRLGLVHGAYCLGCCWSLMLLLFAGGVMNLVWIAGLSILVLLEKLSPFGARLTGPIGVLLMAAGLAVAASAI